MALGSSAAAGVRAEVIDRVLAVVAGQLITLSDVRAAISLGIVTSAEAPDPVAAALDQLVERALMIEEMERYAPPEPGTALVQARMASMQQPFPNAAAFTRALDAAGQTKAGLEELAREELQLAAYIDQRFGASDNAGRRAVVAEWVAGLRRRADLVVLYLRTP